MIPGLDAPPFAQGKKVLEYTVPVSYEPKVRYSNSNLHTVLGLVQLFLPTRISLPFPLLPVSPQSDHRGGTFPTRGFNRASNRGDPFRVGREIVACAQVLQYERRKKSKRQDPMHPIVGTPIVSEFRVPGPNVGIRKIGDGDAGNSSA